MWSECGSGGTKTRAIGSAPPNPAVRYQNSSPHPFRRKLLKTRRLHQSFLLRRYRPLPHRYKISSSRKTL